MRYRRCHGFYRRYDHWRSGQHFPVVHCHALKGYAHIVGGLQWIGLAAHTIGIHIDQTHHHGDQGVLQVTLTGVTAAFTTVGRQPLLFRAPVSVLLRVPDIFPSEAETERLQSYGFTGDGAGIGNQIGSTELVAIFFLIGQSRRHVFSRFALWYHPT